MCRSGGRLAPLDLVERVIKALLVAQIQRKCRCSTNGAAVSTEKRLNRAAFGAGVDVLASSIGRQALIARPPYPDQHRHEQPDSLRLAGLLYRDRREQERDREDASKGERASDA